MNLTPKRVGFAIEKSIYDIAGLLQVVLIHILFGFPISLSYIHGVIEKKKMGDQTITTTQNLEYLNYIANHLNTK